MPCKDKHPQQKATELKCSKNTIIGSVGDFPTLQAKYVQDFPPGEIVLKYGQHLAPNRGFGYIHIIAEHTADLDKHNLEHTIEGVIAYIQLIIKAGAGIYSEFFHSKGNYIPTVFWSKIGMVVLQREQLSTGETRYSIVTAYGKQSPVGQKIGNIGYKKTP